MPAIAGSTTVVKYRVMIVDDQPAFVQWAKRTLEAHPAFQVVGSAARTSQATALLRVYQPDVVLVDILMPSGSGFEGVRQLLAARPDLRVLLISDMDEAQCEVLARSVGAIGFIPKRALGADTLLTRLDQAG